MSMITINDLLKMVSVYNLSALPVIKKAYDYANMLHDGQVRQSGEPYITHPLNVAYILAEMHADTDTICAALLHDTLEDTNITKETNNRRMKIIQAKVIKSTELKKYQMEKMRSEALINSGKDASVVVQKVIFPGCRVEIAGVGIDVRQELKHVKFVLRDGIIEAALLY